MIFQLKIFTNKPFLQLNNNTFSSKKLHFILLLQKANFILSIMLLKILWKKSKGRNHLSLLKKDWTYSVDRIW